MRLSVQIASTLSIGAFLQGFILDLDFAQHDTGGITVVSLMPVCANTVPASQMYVEGHVQAAALECVV